VLLEQAAEALASGHPGAVVLKLPSGITVKMHCKPVLGAGRFAGGVVTVKRVETASRGTADSGPPARMYLPGIVGSGPLWLRGCHEVDAVYGSGDRLALQGERGAGKLALLRAVCQRRNPVGRFHVLDAADANDQDWLARIRQELQDGDGALVIAHVDRLSPRRLHQVSAALRGARSGGRPEALRVAVTLSQERKSDDLAELLSFFPSTVELPPLRHHIEDLHELVRFFLAKLSPDGRLGWECPARRSTARFMSTASSLRQDDCPAG
jgi:sigma-54 dependent transcriptional regulator, acetoin dehydrogenase operon transcriptional activator AcoR